MTPIPRFFKDGKAANAAAARLQEAGFSARSITVVDPKDKGANSAALRAGNSLGRYAAVCAKGVEEGRALVVVMAPFGHGAEASRVLAEAGAVDTQLITDVTRAEAERTSGTPFSDAMMWPVLMKGQPAPLTRLLGVRLLSPAYSMFSGMFAPLARSDWSFSGMLGMGLLSDKAAPLSSMLGFRPLSANPNPGRTSMGFPLLSSSATPLSSLFGMSVLSKEAAPLSEMLGMRTIKDD